MSDRLNESREEYLINMSHDQILETCQFDLKYNSICQDDDFWKKKIYHDYPNFDNFYLPKNIKQLNWKNLYFFISELSSQKIILAQGSNYDLINNEVILYLPNGLSYYIYNKSGPNEVDSFIKKGQLPGSSNSVEIYNKDMIRSKSGKATVDLIDALSKLYTNINQYDIFYDLQYYNDYDVNYYEILDFIFNDENFDLYDREIVNDIVKDITSKNYSSVNIYELTPEHALKLLTLQGKFYDNKQLIAGISQLKEIVNTVNNTF